jgi:predicted peptidase
MHKLGALLSALALSLAAQAQPYPFTVISKVREANPRVVALAIDVGRELPLNWRLENAFQVNAQLLPVKTYAGDLIANSAVAKAPRTVTRAYTSARPEMGSASQGRYVIVEMDPDDFNASSWYAGFNPGIRQMIPYQDKMVYEVRLRHALNLLSANVSPNQPGANVDVLKPDEAFRQAGAKIQVADDFQQGVFEMPANPVTKSLGYNFYQPAALPPGAKVPLVVFLHGSGQSHDYKHFPTDFLADVKSPLQANQGGVTWVERAPEKAFVLVPQAPARDTLDAQGEGGWRGADTMKLLHALVDKMVADHPAIDVNRLYLTGLSMGGMGSWKIITDPDPRIARKFAAAAIFNGVPKGIFAPVPNETPSQKEARIVADLQAFDYRNVAIPIWLGHTDTDPVVSRLGSRVPFAALTGKAQVDATGQLTPAAGVLTRNTPLVRQYLAANRHSGSEVHYTEYQFGNGDNFRELGMVTRNGHFSWEASYKDQAMIDWMFRQVRKAP